MTDQNFKTYILRHLPESPQELVKKKKKLWNKTGFYFYKRTLKTTIAW